MNRMSCHDNRTRLVGYIHHQLPPRQARQVARHLQTCADCYVEYLTQRNLARDLSAGIPRLGQPAAPDISRVWTNIQREMARPERVQRRLTPYGIASLILILSLLLPWAMGTEQVALAVPAQPSGPALARVAEATPTVAVSADATASAPASATNAQVPPAETPNAALTAPSTH